jgi:hypothetical protein
MTKAKATKMASSAAHDVARHERHGDVVLAEQALRTLDDISQWSGVRAANAALKAAGAKSRIHR